MGTGIDQLVLKSTLDGFTSLAFAASLGWGVALSDFKTKLFPGSARLVELADRVQTLQVEALCWCGARATHNARTVDGKMVTEGEQVVVGDVGTTSNIAYEVLCRRHHMRNVTAKVSNPAAEQSLPFNN